MAQFALPAALLGIGILGQWLLGPKKSTTAAPDSMPMLNSALRGQVIPVTFGANRVPAQVVWTKNFTATRQKSSGKGGAKGGGSGGFGSAKGGGSAGVGYLYFWDMMFNFGIFDTPVLISKGWVGSDQLDDATITAITAGISSPFVEPDATNKSAHLAFTEAFFAPGFGTSDINLESWAYFEDQMGFACAWPNTSYVGFNQLELGQTPSVPQLSFELVPINSDITVHGTVYADPDGQLQNETHSMPYIEDDNGDVWSVKQHTDSSDIIIRRIIDGQTITASFSGQLTTDFTLVSPNGGPNSVARFITSIVAVPNTKYFYLTWCDIQFPTTDDALIVILYEITNSTTITKLASRRMWYSSGLSNNYPSTDYAFPMDNGETMTFSTGRSTNRANYVVTLPSPASMIAGGDVDSGRPAHEMTGRTYNMTDLGDDFLAGLSNGRLIVVGFLPQGGSTGQIFFYVPKGRVTYELAHTQNAYIKAAGATYPNGFMVRIDWTGIALTYPAVIDNSYFKIGGVDAVPFADAQLTSTGAAGTDYDDWSAMTPTPDHQNIIMFRGFSDNNKLGHVRMFDGTTGEMLVEKSQVFTTGSFSSRELITNDLYVERDGQIWIQTVTAETSPLFDRWHINYGTVVDFSADVTPPYIVRRILTSDVFGFAASQLFGFTITENSIDEASYLAAHQYCIQQGFLFSVTYSNQDNLLTVLNELVQLYGGFLTERSGKIYFNTVTATDTPVRTIDNHHLVVEPGKPPVKIAKAALEDGYNKILFNYLDRSIDYKQNQVEASDEVDIDINGPRVKTYPSRYVMAGSVAQVIATRALWSNLYGKDQYSFTLGWKDADIRPGALITLVDSFDPTLAAGVRARITHRQEMQRGKFSMEATREFPYIITTSTFFTTQASVDAGYSGLIRPATPPDFQTAYELPKEFQGAKALCYFGYNQGDVCMGAQLYLSVDSGTNFVLTQDQQPFILSGRWASSLEMRPPGYVETNVDFWVLPTPNFDPATPTFIQNYALDDVTQAIRAAGGGVLIVGSEAVAVEDLTLLGQNHYRTKRLFRGFGGSPISAHTSGDFFHAFGAGIFTHEITQNDIGTTLQYKVAPYNFAGIVYDISSIAAKSYTIKGLYWLPREQPVSKIWVSSAQVWPRSVPVTGPYIGVFSGDGVLPAGSDVHLTWSAAANDEGHGAGGYGAGTFGHFIASDSVNYRVDVASKNGVKVSSFIVNTGYFSYTLAQNSTDFTGFGHDLIFTVTPFTVKGDGPVANTRSLSMNW